jgi:hypothetical protein
MMRTAKRSFSAIEKDCGSARVNENGIIVEPPQQYTTRGWVVVRQGLGARSPVRRSKHPAYRNNGLSG